MLENFWAGTAESYVAYQANLEKANAALAAMASDDEVDPFPPLYERDGSVGVVKIEGSLIPGEAGFYRFFGITGYDDIKNALIEAVSDREAKSIMLYCRSPGGSVEGVASCHDFIKVVAGVKPMNVYSEMAASACYWISAAAGHITTTDTGINGSIGTVKVHMERSKMLDMDGIKVTVMRAGKFKMLANSYEPLTEEAKAQEQVMLDDLYEAFASSVAEDRSTTYAIADQVMGQGKVFMGKRGVEAGLVDAVGTYQDAHALASGGNLAGRKTTNITVSATASVAAANLLADNGGNTAITGLTMKKTDLTQEQLLALAAGVNVDEPAATVEEPVVEPAAPAAVAKTEDAGIVAFLKSELATAQASLATAAVAAAQTKNELAAAQSATTAAEASVLALSAIVGTAVGNMGIALGQKVAVTGMSAQALLELHASMSATFKDKFKTGGVAGATAAVEPETKTVTPGVDHRFIYSAQSLNKSK